MTITSRDQLRRELFKIVDDLDDALSVDDILHSLSEILVVAVVKAAPSETEAAKAINDLHRAQCRALPGMWRVREEVAMFGKGGRA